MSDRRGPRTGLMKRTTKTGFEIIIEVHLLVRGMTVRMQSAPLTGQPSPSVIQAE